MTNNNLESIFRRKFFSLFRKWRGLIYQDQPVNVPNLLILLQCLGFRKPVDFPATDNSLNIRIRCTHHDEITYILEIPMDPDQCNCMAAKGNVSSPSTSSSVPNLWNTRRVYPLRSRNEQLEGYSRSLVETLIELVVRLTYPKEKASRILNKDADMAWLLDTLRAEERARSPSARSMVDGVSTETLAQIAHYMEQALCCMDISLGMLPESVRNSDKHKSPLLDESKRATRRRSFLENLVKGNRTPRKSKQSSFSDGEFYYIPSPRAETSNPAVQVGSTEKSRRINLLSTFKRRFK